MDTSFTFKYGLSGFKMRENFSQRRKCFPLGPFVTNTESSKTLGRRELLSEKAFGIYEERVYIRRNQTWKKETMSWENFALRMINPCEIPWFLKLPLHHLQMWESKKGIKRRTKKERQKNAFVVFHAPENVKRKCSNKKCKNRKVRENIFFFFCQTETYRTSSIATISDIYCIIFLLRAFFMK